MLLFFFSKGKQYQMSVDFTESFKTRILLLFLVPTVCSGYDSLSSVINLPRQDACLNSW